jgi:DNA repair protein RadA/Sms
MAKKKSIFECQNCGLQSSRWVGKCPSCNSWDSLIELNNQQIEFLKKSSQKVTSKQKAIAIPIYKHKR